MERFCCSAEGHKRTSNGFITLVQALVGVKKVTSRLLQLAGASWVWGMKQGL